MGQDVAMGLLLSLAWRVSPGFLSAVLSCPTLLSGIGLSSQESFMESHGCVSPRRFSKPIPEPDVPSTQ